MSFAALAEDDEDVDAVGGTDGGSVAEFGCDEGEEEGSGCAFGADDEEGGGGGGDGSCSGITASFERKRNGERCLRVFNIPFDGRLPE